MPTMAPLTVKKADETTNITYDVITPSRGDGNEAVWRQDTLAPASMPAGLRAILKLKSMWNGPKDARRSVMTFNRPHAVLDSTTSLYKANGSVFGRLELTVPQGMPVAEANEGVYQFLNLAAQTLIKQSASTGYAP